MSSEHKPTVVEAIQTETKEVALAWKARDGRT